MNDYPAMITPVNHVEPVPRRIRAYFGTEKVLDTTRALYVWEWPYYPQYYVPRPVCWACPSGISRSWRTSASGM